MDAHAALKSRAAPAEATAAAQACLLRIGRGSVDGARYPFGNPVSIERDHVEQIKRTPYWLAQKSDGTRVALVLTRTVDTRQPVAVLLNRDRIPHASVELMCHAHYFDGSVFDAELVVSSADPSVLFLLVFDVAALGGARDVAQLPLSERLVVLSAVFASQVIQDSAARSTAISELRIVAADPQLHIIAKPMLPLFSTPARGAATRAEVLAQQAAPALAHACDGYILTPEDAPAALPGTAPHIFKIKSLHTLDLKWDRDNLWYHSGDDEFPLKNISDADAFLRGSRTAAALWAPLRCVAHRSIVEVGVHVEHKGEHGSSEPYLSFMRVRADRAAPNQALCVARTFLSARDAVTLEDIVSDS